MNSKNVDRGYKTDDTFKKGETIICIDNREDLNNDPNNTLVFPNDLVIGKKYTALKDSYLLYNIPYVVVNKLYESYPTKLFISMKQYRTNKIDKLKDL